MCFMAEKILLIDALLSSLDGRAKSDIQQDEVSITCDKCSTNYNKTKGIKICLHIMYSNTFNHQVMNQTESFL